MLFCILIKYELFYSHKNVKVLFYTVNSEKISHWFTINITKFTLFHKNSFQNDIPVKLSALMIDSNNIERTSSIKFLRVMLGEHISWTDHVRTVENKIAKNIGSLYRVSQFFNEDSLKTVYFSYIHSYVNNADIAWTSTYATKLKKVYLKQKHAARIAFNKDKLTHSNPLFENLKFIISNIHIPSRKLWFISIRGPKLWNDVINKEESYSLFQKKIKSKLIKIEKETDYF